MNLTVGTAIVAAAFALLAGAHVPGALLAAGGVLFLFGLLEIG